MLRVIETVRKEGVSATWWFRMDVIFEEKGCGLVGHVCAGWGMTGYRNGRSIGTWRSVPKGRGHGPVVVVMMMRLLRVTLE